MFLQRDKREVVPLDFKDYRKHFSISAVPAKLIKDRDGNPVIAKVDRKQAINFLKNLYDFKTKDELLKELQDAVGSVCGTIQGEP